MSARNQEKRPYAAPQVRTVRLRFPNWTRFRPQRALSHPDLGSASSNSPAATSRQGQQRRRQAIPSAEAILAARVRAALRAAFSFAAERLPGAAPAAIYPTMFVVTEADATAIRAIYEQEGELSAAIEVRRRFPGIVDNEKARQCARTIAGWTPRPIPAATITPLRPRKGRP
jgi:hypothetical protein